MVQVGAYPTRNRELFTLECNARLLDLAADESLPLLERVKMCRFFSSNLDEFSWFASQG